MSLSLLKLKVEQGDAKSDSDSESEAEGQNDNAAKEVAEAAAEEAQDENESEEDLDVEEDDEDDEEDEDDNKGKRKKMKKPRFGGFILDEAEVDNEVEDEEEWEEGAEDIIDRSCPTEENTSREMENHRRLQMMFTSQKEEEIEDYYLKKYAGTSAAEKDYDNLELPDEIAQKSLLPCVKDPNLWLVKCRIGEEKATALKLMQKFIAKDCTNESCKKDLILVANEIGEYVPPTAKICCLKEIILNSDEYKGDPDFVEGILETAVTERKVQEEKEFELEKPNKEKECELEKLNKEREFEL
ncbi:Transcription elongation factor SPT5 [Araneus ventricosus]|uniref:Transcription elongation factor SPT5 n=1 Tax=Araneus ventricosus TaxID=182803 RepID=A0A4Y2CNC0_ARAVE|nr:Transcription elongation factor SPT5 [Araneus ventricosus]